MLTTKSILIGQAKRVIFVLALFAIGQTVFAVSGIKSTGGGNKSKASASGTYSNLKTSVPFSLKDKYKYNRNGSTLLLNSPSGSVTHNVMVTFRKGNITYIIPYKTKLVKLPNFLRDSPLPSTR